MKESSKNGSIINYSSELNEFIKSQENSSIINESINSLSFSEDYVIQNNLIFYNNDNNDYYENFYN